MRRRLDLGERWCPRRASSAPQQKVSIHAVVPLSRESDDYKSVRGMKLYKVYITTL
jgi:hypothetical protein